MAPWTLRANACFWLMKGAIDQSEDGKKVPASDVQRGRKFFWYLLLS